MSSHTGRTLGVTRRALFRLVAEIACATALAIIPVASAQVPSIPPQGLNPTKVIVVGFVGGFVRSDDVRQPAVQLVRQLSEEDIYGLHAAVFENRHLGEARKEVLHWLDTDGNGHLSRREKQNAHIILFGHSWGGSAAIKLARDLNRQGIPVLLTIEIDSVNRLFGNDCLIPPNVTGAVNFYQTRGLAHGCRAIRAADPKRTRILGNYRFDYTSQPSGCRAFPWVDRHFLKTHQAMDCDPCVWSQVDYDILAQVQRFVKVRPVRLPQEPDVLEAMQ
jgi:pimeloyl-ACP methyl ester carboxylesterase